MLTFEVWFDKTSIRPNEIATGHLVVEVRAQGLPVEKDRRSATTVFAIDVSGSMQGDPLDHVVSSVDRLLDGLGPGDRVGVVAFSGTATCVARPVPLDDGGKRELRAAVAKLFAEGQTNIEAGLRRALETLTVGAPEGHRRGIVLLSDGEPNEGASTVSALRDVVRSFRADASVSVLGYGINHAEDILAGVGEAGGGGYAFVPNPRDCGRAFARALGAQADVVADGIGLRLAPAAGVEIVRLLGGEAARFGSEGLTVSVPDMIGGSRRVIVAEVRVRAPLAERFAMSVAKVELTSRSPGTRDVVRAEQDVVVEISLQEARGVREAEGRVVLVRADAGRAAARALADRGQFGAAATTLRRLVDEIRQVPGFVVGEATPLGEAHELLMDEAAAMDRRPDPEAYRRFRKSAVGSQLAVDVPAATSSRGVTSAHLLERAAGKLHEAYVVVRSGMDAGRRYRLREECMIGRTANADVALEGHGVARRHAEIYAVEGEFWLADLGSTSRTTVNGSALGAEPRRLAQGDVIGVGDVELVYEQA